MDGNKRTALAACEMFVRLNGRLLGATNEELEELTLAVASGTRSKDEVAEFMRQHVT